MKKFKKLRTIAAIMAALFMVQAVPFSAMAVGSGIDDSIDHEAIIDQLHADEAANAEDQAIVAEETSLRGANEKHFRLEDGSYVAAQYPNAVHYKDENGNWVDIDNTLSFEESKSDDDFDGYTNKENSFSVKLAENAEDQLFRLEDGENSISMKLSEDVVQRSEISVENTDNGVAEQSELSVEEQNEETMSLDSLTAKAEYTDVMPGVDLEYTVMPDGVKEYIVVNEKLTDYEFSFELVLGDMYLRENADNSISIMTADGDEKYIIPAPYMTDANDRYSDAVEYTVSDMSGGVYTLTVTADAAWIEDSETAFPVRIDPSITSKSNSENINDTYVSNKYPTNINHKKSTVLVGTDPDDGTTRTYLTWDFSDVSSSFVITSAKLRYYQHKNGRSYNPTIEAYKIIKNDEINNTWDGNLQNISWNNQPVFNSSDLLDYVAIQDYEDGMYNEWDITKAVFDKYIGKKVWGVMLKAKIEGIPNSSVMFDSSFDTSLPVIEVCYRNQQGLDSGLSYMPFQCGNAGTAYINTYNGDISFVHDTIKSSEGESLLNCVYNTYMISQNKTSGSIESFTCFSNETIVGDGWKMSVQENIVPVTQDEMKKIKGDPEYSSGTGYAYNDIYGTNIYFIPSAVGTNTYTDINKLGYTLTVEADEYVLLTPDESTKRFDITEETINNVTRNKGYITQSTTPTQIKDTFGNYVNATKEINYYYVRRCPTRLDEVEEIIRVNNTEKINSVSFNYDTANPRLLVSVTIGRKNISFAYNTADSNKNWLESITEYDPDAATSKYKRTTFLYNSNNTLKSITAPDGNVLRFNYNYDSNDDNFGEYSNSTSNRIVSVDWYKTATAVEKIRTSFEFKSGVTTVHYFGNDMVNSVKDSTSTDDVFVKFLFDLDGNNTAVYTQNAAKQSHEKIASKGIKGMNQKAINDSNMSPKWYANEELISGSNSFKLNASISSRSELSISEDAHTGDSAYAFTAIDSSKLYDRYMTKEVFLTPGIHTFSAYVKCTEPIDGTIKLYVEDIWEYISEETEGISQTNSNVDNGWQKISLTFDTYSPLLEEYDDEEARDFYLEIGIEQTAGATILVDDITLDGKILSWPTSGNAAVSCGFEGNDGLRWEITNTPLNYADTATNPENVLFGNRSLMIEGAPAVERSVYNIYYLNNSSAKNFVLSGWGKADSVPTNNSSVRGFELFAYYIYYVKTKDNQREMRTVSTAIPFNWQSSEWQYVSSELKMPKAKEGEELLSVYSVTIGALYKGGSGTAYFDNIELTPVQ